MPASFVLFASALIGILIAGGAAAALKNPKAKAVANGATALLIVVALVGVIAGLWSAWAPWDLTWESK